MGQPTENTGTLLEDIESLIESPPKQNNEQKEPFCITPQMEMAAKEESDKNANQ